jgi:hypothetical protein
VTGRNDAEALVLSIFLETARGGAVSAKPMTRVVSQNFARARTVGYASKGRVAVHAQAVQHYPTCKAAGFQECIVGIVTWREEFRFPLVGTPLDVVIEQPQPSLS